MDNNDLTKLRESVYFVQKSALPITDEVISLFDKKPAQKKILLEIDRIHRESSRGTFLRLSELSEACGSSSSNYLRRNFANKPLAFFVKEVELPDSVIKRKDQKSYTLDYSRLNSKAPLDNQDETDSIIADQRDSRKRRSAELAKAKEKYGFESGLVAERHFSTTSFSLLASLVESTERRTVTRPLHKRYPNDGKATTVTITNDSGYITQHKDAVIAFAALQLTWAHHAIKRQQYLNTHISPKNETPVSLVSIAKLVDRSVTTDNYKAIRNSLDVNRKTVFSFNKSIRDTVLNTAPSIRMFERCDPVINDLSEGKTEKQIFDESGYYVISWDQDIWQSIISQPSHHAMPEHLFKIDPTLVILYLKLRSKSDLQINSDTEDETIVKTTLNADVFFKSYLDVDVDKFLQIVYNQQKLDKRASNSPEKTDSSRKTKRESYLGYSPASPACFDMFGYTFDLNDVVDTNSITREFTISCSRKSINQHLNLPSNNDGTPTIPNELPYYLQVLLEQDEGLNSYRKRAYQAAQHHHYAEFKDNNTKEDHVILTRYTSDEKRNNSVTNFQTKEHPRDELMKEFNSLIEACHWLEDQQGTILTKEMLMYALKEIILEMQLGYTIDPDVVVKYLSENPTAIGEVTSLWNHQLEMRYETMTSIANLASEYR